MDKIILEFLVNNGGGAEGGRALLHIEYEALIAACRLSDAGYIRSINPHNPKDSEWIITDEGKAYLADQQEK